eukprot:gene24042-32456_t
MEGAKGTVAVKFQDVLQSDTEEQINLLVELSISKYFYHENIVRCLGVGRTQTLPSEQNVKAKVFIVMEYHERGTLREVLRCKLSWHDKIMLARDIANGLMYIHEKKLIHRDIKTENILISEKMHAYICDFSFICHRRSSSKSQYTYGTDEFMSPEIALATDYDTASDIFSFGIVICEIITGIPPSKTFMCRQPRNTFSLDEEEVGRNVTLDCPEGLEALAYQCCDVDPKKRPTASMCVEELELIAIEWRIDEHENKSRARALSFSGGSPGKAAATNSAERSNEAFQTSQMLHEEQKEISQLYTDITNKLATIELCEAVESGSSEDLYLSSESKDSFDQSGQQEKEFALTVEPDVAFNERTIIDSHIEDKLKPMLQTMLGRLESIEQNLNKTSQANDHLAAALLPSISMPMASNSSQELLKQDDRPHSEEVYKIMTLQSQIDELKAAMMSMTQGSGSSATENALSKPASPLSKPSGKWNAFFEDMQSKVESEKKSIEFNEVHVMNRHHRQASDDVSVNSSSAEPSADSQDARESNKLQIVEHLAYTVDKQPIHVRERIYYDQSKNALESSGSAKKGRSREDRKKEKTNRANEQLSKALGSFLEVISRCNQTSATVMDAMNATESANVFGMKSPVVPSVHYIPIGASSPPSPPQSSSVVDFDPQYNHHHHSYSEVPPQGGMAIDGNSYNDHDYSNGNYNEESPGIQYSQRVHHSMLDKSNRSNSAHLPFEASERIQKQKQHAQRRGEQQQPQQQLQRSQSFQSPSMSTSKRVKATGSNGRQRGGSNATATATPHYAMATKTSTSAQASPRLVTASQRSVSSMNTNTNSDSYSNSNSNNNTPNRLRSKSPNKESLSTRKSPFSYSFPSDSKPRLGFDVASNSRLRSPATREMPQTFNSSTKPVKTGGGSAMPLSTVLNRR